MGLNIRERLQNNREIIQVMVKMINTIKSKAALEILICALFIICGCASTTGVDVGRDDVSNYELLKLSTKLSPPALIEIKEGGLRQVEFIWPIPATDIYRYRIERAAAAGGPFVFVAHVEPELRRFVDGSYAETQLKENTTYFYRMIAIQRRRGPRSLPGPVLKATTAPPPQPVTSLKVIATGSRANTLSWSASLGMGIAKYRVERAFANKPGDYAIIGTTKITDFVDGGTPASTLLDSTQYSYRVITVNEVNSESAPSICSEVTTFPPPVAVTDFTCSTGEVRCAPLQWSAAPEKDVTAYNLYRSRGADEKFKKFTIVNGRNSLKHIDGGGNPGDLEDEGLYLYMIKAVNAVGAESAASEVLTVLTRPVPPEIQGVTVVSGMPREVMVSWTLSPDITVDGYEIWRSLQNSDEWQQIKLLENNKISRFLDRGEEEDLGELGTLLDGTGYVYRVISYNTGDVRSSASIPIMAKTKDLPITPSGVTASSGLAGVVNLNWISNSEKDIRCYEVECSSKESRGFKSLCTVTADLIKAKEDSLKVNVTRYYRIKAVANDRLESEWSAVVSGVTKALPDAPFGLLQSKNLNSVILKWSPPQQQDIDHYVIWAKRMIGWRQISSCKVCDYQITADDLENISTVAVTAVDKDGLESEKSDPLKLMQ